MKNIKTSAKATQGEVLATLKDCVQIFMLRRVHICIVLILFVFFLENIVNYRKYEECSVL